MFNHNRGLWGYTGAAADGEPLTIQSTGMGGPSAAIVLEELCDLGVRRAVRVGTCGGLDGSLSLGELIVAREALCEDGTSRRLAGADRVPAPGSLAPEGDRSGLVVTTDLFYDPDPAREETWRAAGALAVEMETAALFAVGARRGIEVASVLAVSDLLAADGGRSGSEGDPSGGRSGSEEDPSGGRSGSEGDPSGGRTRIDEEALVAASSRLGHAGAAALLG
jgi:uridine phosphorylase